MRATAIWKPNTLQKSPATSRRPSPRTGYFPCLEIQPVQHHVPCFSLARSAVPDRNSRNPIAIDERKCGGQPRGKPHTVRTGSTPAGHRALITTTLHSEAANSGAKLGTGRCTFESCRTHLVSKGPRADKRRNSATLTIDRLRLRWDQPNVGIKRFQCF
jgi:hypothetical protein